MAEKPYKFVLQNPLSPGDVIVSSALFRDIHKCHPGMFQLGYTGSCKSLFHHNSNIVALNPNDDDVETIRLHYSLVHQANQTRHHFMYGYHKDFNMEMAKRGIQTDVKLTEFKPDVHFSEEEINEPLVNGQYWVICGGGKHDFTAKWWDPHKWQRVVEILKDEVQFVQVGSRKHFHPKLKGSNVQNLIGKTEIRDLMRLVLHSQGSLCVVTCVMHMAAACQRPCVVVAGGREGWWWEAYTRKNRDANMKLLYGDDWTAPDPDEMVDHVFLHTIGKHGLQCCSTGGCWRSKVEGGRNKCRNPVKGPTIPQPKCLMYIEPEHVVEAIRMYNKLGWTDRYDLPEAVVEKKKELPVQVNMSIDTESLQPPITICALCYGPFVDLHKRCLSSIVDKTPAGTFELRVGLNEVSDKTLEWVNTVLQDRLGDKLLIYHSKRNIMKYPLMRRMFHDPDNPITSKWVVWFDDDSHVTDEDWLPVLSRTIKQNYPKHVMFGKKYFWHLRGTQEEWIKAANWYGGKPIPIDRRHGNRLKIDFATGGWWAVPMDWIKKMDWPDRRINHNGGDTMMGAALHQQGGTVKNHSYGIKISDHKRRGFSENHPGVR
jgi:ADP-heptose:LPS heptosyltransferase